MKSYDNNGKLVGEINHSRTADGRSITTNTQYNTYNGQPTSQNVSVRTSNGKVYDDQRHQRQTAAVVTSVIVLCFTGAACHCLGCDTRSKVISRPPNLAG